MAQKTIVSICGTLCKKRLMTLCVVVIICAITGIFAYFKYRTTLPHRLDREARELFLPGTLRQTIEKWAKTQSADSGTIRKTGGTFRYMEIIASAGLDPDSVGSMTSINYNESRWPDNYRVSLYFFFDTDDRLIKHWVTEDIVSF